jgi:hypothetical protein
MLLHSPLMTARLEQIWLMSGHYNTSVSSRRFHDLAKLIAISPSTVGSRWSFPSTPNFKIFLTFVCIELFIHNSVSFVLFKISNILRGGGVSTISRSRLVRDYFFIAKNTRIN